LDLHNLVIVSDSVDANGVDFCQSGLELIILRLILFHDTHIEVEANPGR
jgi:hypothetical protein